MKNNILYIILLLNLSVFGQAPDWTVDYTQYEYNMVITGVVELNDSLIEHSDGLMVSAFIGDECRGIANYKTYDHISGSRINMMVYSNTIGDEIKLKAYLPENDTIVNIEQSYVFESLGREGSLEYPVALEIIVLEWAKPEKPDMPEGENNICQGLASSSYSVSELENTESYEWYVLPENAATFRSSTNSVELSWTANFTGHAYLYLKAKNKNGYSQSSDSLLITVNEKPETPVVVMVSEGVLQSSVESGNQWYLQNFGKINGATQQNYIYTIEGYYYVIAENEGCFSDTSNVFFAQTTSINENKNRVAVFPNPAKNIVNIDLADEKIQSIKICNNNGTVVFANIIKELSASKIDLTDFESGLYFIVLKSNKGIYTKKLIIK